MNELTKIAVVGALGFLLGSPASAQERAASMETGVDIVETAVAAGSFGTLVAAVEAAGLVETLKGEGPFTVFAPTDEAFAKLPEGTLEELLKPESREKLQAILTYHVVPGRLRASEVVSRSGLRSVQGGELGIRVRDGVARVDGARILTADVMASNGVIHVIDTVVLPD